MKNLICAVLFLTALTCAGAEVPKLVGRVNDYAAVLTRAQMDELENMLKADEAATSDQIVVLTVASLEGEGIEEFANKVFHKWELGQKKKDNGVLFLYSRDDHKSRIEVGRGLEGRLNDAKAGRILRDTVAPQFRKGAYYDGIHGALDAIMGEARGEFEATPANVAPSSNFTIVALVVGAVITLICSLIYWLVGGIAGAISGYVVALLAGLSWPMTVLFIIVGFIVGIAARLILTLDGSQGMGSLGSSDSSWSSSSSNDSSFSGGGGDSGGGGASADT